MNIIDMEYDKEDMWEPDFEGKLSDEKKQMIKNIENLVYNKIIPDTYPDYMIHNWSMSCAERRRTFISNIGFTLVSWDWIKPLSQFLKGKKCLEVMSGTGALSYALQQAGVNIIASDDFSWNSDSSWNKNKNYWTNIENIDAIEAVKKYGKDIDIIIMSWPYMDDIAYKVLQTMRKVNSKCQMIYIGEDRGGCTANDDFFDNVIDIQNDLIDEANKYYHRWSWIYDYIRLVH